MRILRIALLLQLQASHMRILRIALLLLACDAAEFAPVVAMSPSESSPGVGPLAAASLLPAAAILSPAVTVSALAAGAGWQLHVSLAVAAGFAVNVFVLTPLINFYRDRDLDGDAAAKRIFGLLHLASVVIFIAQLAGSLAIVGMFLYSPV